MERGQAARRIDNVENPITGMTGCCARAANGHAAAPPSSVMNERRFS
jgi:hypothetical protein